MSARAGEVAAVKAARDDHHHHHQGAAGRGHTMRWQLGENARRRGYGYFWAGRCAHCAAEITIGSGWTSCPAVRDARHVACSGPGTTVLTEIETARAGEQVTAAVAEFGAALKAAHAERNRQPRTHHNDHKGLTP